MTPAGPCMGRPEGHRGDCKPSVQDYLAHVLKGTMANPGPEPESPESGKRPIERSRGEIPMSIHEGLSGEPPERPVKHEGPEALFVDVTAWMDELAADMDRRVWDSLITAMLAHDEDPADDELWRARKVQLALALKSRAELIR